jgi:GWxTD domain-containing protein
MVMRHGYIVLALLFAGCSSAVETVQECYSSVQLRRAFAPSFTSYTMHARSDSMNRSDIYIQMPFHQVRFERTAEGFKASYSMTFIIRNKLNDIVQTKEVERHLTVRSFEESVSNRFDVHFQSFALPSGEYTADISAVDELSKLRYRSVQPLQVPDLSEAGERVSSILFTDRIQTGEKGISLRPVLPSSIAMLKDSLGLFQMIYRLRTGDTVIVADQYFRRRIVLEEDDGGSFMQPPYAQSSNHCHQPMDSLYYHADSTVTVGRSGDLQLVVTRPLPESGSSQLVRTVIVRSGDRADTSIFRQSIFIRDYRLRNALTLDEVVSAMRFVLRQEEYDSIRTATGAHREEHIRAFWSIRGGNERRAEFERKVIEANTMFTSCVDGAGTAMGAVYYICGVPDFIECRGKYAETWYYNIGDRAYPFEFRRESDENHYYELSPFSVNEYVWQYFVDRWRKRL